MSRVSVAMCSCNREDYIAESLDALGLQTRSPDELVIADDGSRDGTIPIIESFARDAPFPVRLLTNRGQRLGLARNYDRAIGACTGEVVALCDDDDVWTPTKLARVLDVLEGPGAPLLAFSDAALVDRRREPTGMTLWQAKGLKPSVPERHRERELFELLLRTNVAYTSTVAFRSELKAAALPIPEVWKPDWWLTSLAAATGRAAPIDAPLVEYRQHPLNARGFGRRRPVQQLSKVGLDNLAEYRLQIAQASSLRARLEGRGGGAEGARILRLLDDKIGHLETRIEMRGTTRPRRLALVAGELLRGHYRRYSLGYRSALKDAAF